MVRRRGARAAPAGAVHEDESFAGLAHEIAKKRPEAVAIAAVLSGGAGALVRELHAALGSDVPIIAPDGFRLIEDVVALAGPAAKRLYVSEFGIANEELPTRGRQFLDAFAAARGGDGRRGQRFVPDRVVVVRGPAAGQ